MMALPVVYLALDLGDIHGPRVRLAIDEHWRCLGQDHGQGTRDDRERRMITSSSGCRSSRLTANCKATVPLATATPYLRPQ